MEPEGSVLCLQDPATGPCLSLYDLIKALLTKFLDELIDSHW